MHFTCYAHITTGEYIEKSCYILCNNKIITPSNCHLFTMATSTYPQVKAGMLLMSRLSANITG